MVRQISEALTRPNLIPQAFSHWRDNSRSPDRYGMQESDKSGPKQEYSIGKEGGRLIIF